MIDLNELEEKLEKKKYSVFRITKISVSWFWKNISSCWQFLLIGVAITIAANYFAITLSDSLLFQDIVNVTTAAIVLIPTVNNFAFVIHKKNKEKKIWRLCCVAGIFFVVVKNILAVLVAMIIRNMPLVNMLLAYFATAITALSINAIITEDSFWGIRRGVNKFFGHIWFFTKFSLLFFVFTIILMAVGAVIVNSVFQPNKERGTIMIYAVSYVVNSLYSLAVLCFANEEK